MSISKHLTVTYRRFTIIKNPERGFVIRRNGNDLIEKPSMLQAYLWIDEQFAEPYIHQKEKTP